MKTSTNLEGVDINLSNYLLLRLFFMGKLQKTLLAFFMYSEKGINN